MNKTSLRQVKEREREREREEERKTERAEGTLFLAEANYISLSHLPAVSWTLKDCLTRKKGRKERRRGRAKNKKKKKKAKQPVPLSLKSNRPL